MNIDSFVIRIETIGTPKEREESLKEVVEYLLNRYCEVLEYAEGDSLLEGFDGGTG
jgi:hypothetical protein